MKTLEEAMAAQLAIQRMIGGTDPRDRAASERANFVREMAWAATSELNEAMDEYQWKSWSLEQGTFLDRDAFVSELVDVWQFWANLAMMADLTAEEFFARLESKHDINRKRVRDGYDNRNKCPSCHRAFDDKHVNCTPTACTRRSVTT